MLDTRHHPASPEQVHQLGHAQRVPTHNHSQGHLVYPEAGVLSLITAEGSWVAPPNRCVWVPAGFGHRHRAHGSTVMRVVFLPAEVADRLPPRAAVLSVSALVREAILALTTQDARPRESRDLLRRLVVEELAAAPEQPLHLPEPVDDRLLAVTRLASEDLTSPVTLAELGRTVGASERTLSRLFRQETGMGFRQWRTQLRVHHALVMLADGRTVLDTAAACGWSNPTGFIEAFTELVGQTPGRYRRAVEG